MPTTKPNNIPVKASTMAGPPISSVGSLKNVPTNAPTMPPRIAPPTAAAAAKQSRSTIVREESRRRRRFPERVPEFPERTVPEFPEPTPGRGAGFPERRRALGA